MPNWLNMMATIEHSSWCVDFNIISTLLLNVSNFLFLIQGIPAPNEWWCTICTNCWNSGSMASIFNAHGPDDSHDSPSRTRTPSLYKYPPTQKKIWISLSNLVFIHNRNIWKRKICKRKGGIIRLWPYFKHGPIHVHSPKHASLARAKRDSVSGMSDSISDATLCHIDSHHSRKQVPFARPWKKKGVIQHAWGASASFFVPLSVFVHENH